MSKPAKSDTPPNFEAALAELEKIVASMENGQLSLEQSLEFIRDEECLEVTPKSVRLRKVILGQNDRSKRHG